MWAHTLLDERIRQNLKEVASAVLCEIPLLISRLGKRDSLRDTAFHRQEKTAVRVHEGESWERCRLRLMRTYFSDARRWTPRIAWKPNELSSSTRKPRVSLPPNLHLDEHSEKSARAVRMSLPGEKFWVKEKPPTQSLPGDNFWEAADKENAQ
jgi:hypothetical protein